MYSAPSSDCEMHDSEEATFYSTAVSNVCTALCILTSENRQSEEGESHVEKLKTPQRHHVASWQQFVAC